METITEKFVKTLNKAYAADPNCIYALQAAMFPCVKESGLIRHPNIVVQESPVFDTFGNVDENSNYTLSFLGLLNGLLESAGEQKITAIWTTGFDRNKLLGFGFYDK